MAETSAAGSRALAAKGNFVGLFAGDWATEEKTSFLAESFTVFSSLQKIAAEEAQRVANSRQAASAFGHGASSSSIRSLLPPVQTLQYYHRISGLYRTALRAYIQKLESSIEAKAEQGREISDETLKDLEIAQAIHTALHFAEIVYVPSDGRGAGVVGEEILHWLNSFDFAPRTEDGQEIAQHAVPHEHPNFWDYVLRCVLRGFNTSAASLLSSLASMHESPSLRKIAQHVCDLLSGMPRSTAFNLEHDFISAHRRWLGQVRSTLNKLEQDMDEMEAELARGTGSKSKDRDAIEDERLEYEAQFRCLLELMAGVRERVFEACDDWREALGAWGVLIQPALKRDDIPEIIDVITTTLPVDSTLPSESVLVALAKGSASEACKRAHDTDAWLAAHLTDLLDRVGLLAEEDDDMRQDEVSLRIQYIEEYAQTILDDQGLWRLAVDYLGYCGAHARRKMRAIILDVPFTGPEVQKSKADFKRAEEVEADADDAEMDEEADDPESAAEARKAKQAAEKEAKRVGDEFSVAMEIIETCVQLGMDLEARAVCKRMAAEMAKQKRVGPALAYCVRAGDTRQIKRIADEILALYVDQGPEAFCEAVDSIPFSLLSGSAASLDGESGLPGAPTLPGAVAAYSSRLAFLSRYRDFHRLMSEQALLAAASALMELITSQIAPEPFWAVLLTDAVPLLQAEASILASGAAGTSVGGMDETAAAGGEVLSASDSIELLRVLERILSTASMHPRQAQYMLGMLERASGHGKGSKGKEDGTTTNGMALDGDDDEDDSESAAWEAGTASFDGAHAKRTLEALRLGLARHLARTVVSPGAQGIDATAKAMTLGSVAPIGRPMSVAL